jgi:hypothetical protein
MNFIRYFEKHTVGRKTGIYRLLVLDGHESHHSAEFEIFCKAHNIVTLCMPSHSSHLLQSLDVVMFGFLKRSYGRMVEKLMRISLTRIFKEDFFPAFKDAFFEVFGQANVQSGFRGAGFVSCNPETVIAKLDIKLRTPTPDIESMNLSELWQSQTPYNSTEVQYYFAFLKKRILRH